MLSFAREISLAQFTTFGVGGVASYFAEISNEDDLCRVVDFVHTKELPLFVLGMGSNVLISDKGFSGLVMRNKILGYDHAIGANCVRVSAGAGEAWDGIVAYTVESGWSGIECLSGIPGTVGAAPVQNIGAYGVSIASSIVGVRAYDTQKEIFIEFERSACDFGYRSSVFKKLSERYIISRVTFELRQGENSTLPAYHDIQKYFSDQQKEVTVQNIRVAVLDIRKKKGMLIFPEGDSLKSAGSFFKNPVATQKEFEYICGKIGEQEQSEGPWFWKMSEDKIKVAAACLIEHVEHARFHKGYKDGEVGLSPYHTLSLIQYGNASAGEIVSFARNIQEKVFQEYGVILEPEVQCVGFDEYPFLKK